MNATAHYTIQDMVKAAASGAQEQASVTMEAMRQLANAGEPTPSVKLASAFAPDIESIPTNYVEKLAAAVDYIIETTKIAEETGPGKGPNAMQVLEATSSNNEFEAGQGGTATPAHVVPKTPGTHKPDNIPHGPSNALEDNASMMHPAQPVKLSSASIELIRKTAGKGTAFQSLVDKARGSSAGLKSKATDFVAKHPGATVAGASAAGIGGGLALRNHIGKKEASVDELRKVAKFPLNEGSNKDDQERAPKKEQAFEKKLEGKEGKEGGGEGKKEASGVDPRLVDLYLSMVKSAEDAINPAKIAAGAAVPPETSMAGEAGGAPAGGQPQGPTGLIGSNEAAIKYTKGEAKSQVKGQLAKVLTEPALSAAHDHTLNQAFDHTGQAGVKISSAVSTSVRTASARAILEKLAAEACGPDGKPKKKVSAGMGSFQAPPVGGVGSAGATM